MEVLGALGTQVASAILMLAVVLLPAAVVDWANKRFGKPYDREKGGPEGGLGYAIQALLYFILVAILWVTFQPAREALASAICKNSDDYQACMENDASDIE